MAAQQPNETVERTDTGVSISVELKRGTGTRDQDKIVGKYKARSLDEYLEEREIFISALEAEATKVRNIQPGDDDG